MRLVSVSLFAIVSSAAVPTWLTHQVSIFADTVTAWYSEPAQDIAEAILGASQSITSERQANLVADVLIDLRKRLRDFESRRAVLNSLDANLVSLGVDMTPFVDRQTKAVLNALRHVQTPDERLEMLTTPFEHLTDFDVLCLGERLMSDYWHMEEFSQQLGRDLRKVSVPWIARTVASSQPPIKYRMNNLYRLSVRDGKAGRLAHQRTGLLDNDETRHIYRGLFNEFLPVIASLRMMRDLPDFIDDELDLVEEWLSSGFTNMDDCPRLIARALQDAKSLSGLIPMDPAFVEARAAVFAQLADQWTQHCPRTDVTQVYYWGSTMLEIGITEFQTMKRLDSRVFGYEEIHSLSRAMMFEASDYPEEIKLVIQAAAQAALDSRPYLDPVQTDSLMAALHKTVALVEQDMFSGLIEGAHQLGRFGVRLLQHTSIPDQSDERMRLIRRIISFWLFSPTDLEVRARMIELMRSANDEQLREMEEAWHAYTTAYDQFKREATLEEAVSGFLPASVMAQADSFETLRLVREYCADQTRSLKQMLIAFPKKVHAEAVAAMTVFAEAPSVMESLPVMAGNMYFTHLLPLLRSVFERRSSLSQTLVDMPWELNGAVFRALLMSRSYSGELQLMALETLGLIFEALNGSPSRLRELEGLVVTFLETLAQLSSIGNDGQGLTESREAYFRTVWRAIRNLLTRLMDPDQVEPLPIIDLPPLP